MLIELHKFFNNLKRYSFPFESDKKNIPKNGIYILFEKGESYRSYDRIVRVGTHTGRNQLQSRLRQHFIKENKNRSIFRKNIGRCFLNQEQHPYLDLWELDITSKEEKSRNMPLLDLDFEKYMEKKISNYIQTNFTFCAFQMDNKEDRLFWESRIISTLARAEDFCPSDNWFGHNSPKEKIRNSGLWQVNELYNHPLTSDEWNELQSLIASRESSLK